MNHKLSRMLGFTMIELLVVIAVIGILAVAVLSAINPIEQINKGKDTRTRSDAAELLGSIERAYTTQELFPWNISTTTAPAGTTIPVYTSADADPTIAYNSTGDWGFLASLVTSSEVKPAFGQRVYQSYNGQTAGEESFVVLKDADEDRVAVCFLPTSRQFKMEAAKRCCANTTEAGICQSAGSLAAVQVEEINGYAVCANTNGADWEDLGTRNLICLP